MRTARLLGIGRCFYHVISRVVDRRQVFEARDKEILRRILRNQEAFSGVRIVTYCLMSNHFHLLLEVPDRETLAPLDEEGLLRVLPLLYEGDVVEGVKQELERARLSGDEAWHREILSRYERRRGDLALFLKEVKLRITFYMNKRLGRKGTLWEGRYGAVLGAAEFVNTVFEREQALRKRFGEKRTSGARRMHGADWGELRVLRDLQKDVIGT